MPMQSMKHQEVRNLESIPVGSLGLVALPGYREMVEKVDEYLIRWRTERENEHKNSLAFAGYIRPSYIVGSEVPRFGTGEGKGVLKDSVRGMDLYFLVDVANYSITYKLFGQENHMSPDDHFADLKRVIAAVGGKARRITVIMPYLYEGRQYKRSMRESLDCAIPLNGFDTIQPAYQFVKGLLGHVEGLTFDSSHMMVISPDEAGTKRAIYFANVLGLDMGMFYKRRDYTVFENGMNPVIAHEFLGSSVEGKDMLVIDDMLSSGDSVLEVARALKKRNAGRVFILSTFGLFTQGLEKFDKAHKEGVFDYLLTTDLIYQTPELLSRDWYISCGMSKYIAYIIDTLNHDSSISDLLNPVDRITSLVARYNENGKHVVE